MNEISQQDIMAVNGAGTFGDIGAALTGAAIISGGLATIPTPATPALYAFTAIAGVMGVGAGWIDTHYG